MPPRRFSESPYRGSRGADESKNFIDYEMKVNAALGATKVAAVCTYRTGVTADELIAIITAHQDPLYQVAAS